MGERLLCKQEVIGSIPFTSTSRRAVGSWLFADRDRRFAGASRGARPSFFDMVKREVVCDLDGVARAR